MTGADKETKRAQLTRLVRALSGACERDDNLLKDGELVDMLETRGRAIARQRKQQRKLERLEKKKLSLSPVQNKTAKKLKTLVLAGESKAAEGVAKRRKLSLDDDAKMATLDAHGYSHGHALSASCLFPSIERQQQPKPRESMDEWISSLQGCKVATAPQNEDENPLVYMRPTTPTTVGVAVGATDGSVLVKPVKTYPYGCSRRSASPQLLAPRAVKADSPFQSLDRSVSPASTVDLSMSLASTASLGYDGMYDEYSVSSETMRRYACSASDRTQSFESGDWPSSDDDSCDESLVFHSIADEVEEARELSRSAQAELHAQSALRSSDAHVGIMELAPGGSEGYYSSGESEPASPSAVSSTEAVMKVLYSIMEHNENFKWLLDSTNQARVAKLVEYRLKERRGRDDARFIDELRAQVDQLVQENVQIQSQHAQYMKLSTDEASRKDSRTVAEMEARLQASLEDAHVQQGCRREAEAAFQMELDAKSRQVSSLQQEILEKDVEIAQLMGRMVGAEAQEGDEKMVSEVAKLKNTVMEKDREICRLNMQMSTKQKLVDEVAKQVVERLDAEAGDLHLDMDVFLFKSVASKQQLVDELRAAVGTMEREVSGLEKRVSKKTRESMQLKTKAKALWTRLCESKVNTGQLQTENDRLMASLKQKQAKMHDLIEFLEAKEKQVMHLEEQVGVRQTQLEHVLTEYEKLSAQQAVSGRPMARSPLMSPSSCAREQESLVFEHSSGHKGRAPTYASY